MARPLRIEYEGAFYHITARGNERKRIFFGKGDYDKFKEYLLEAQDKYGYRLHCYVLLGNHYHLVIETPNGNMNKVLHYINGSYANYMGGKDLRDMAIYLLKRHTSVLNRQIGDLFEGLTYSGVSKANQRFSMRMSGDRSLRKAVENITSSMSNGKVPDPVTLGSY